MFNKVIFTVLLVLVMGQSALSHDTWIEKSDGQLLVLRGHGGKVEAYDPALVKEAIARDGKGQAVEMDIVKGKENASLLPKEKPAIVGALYDSGYWLKTTDGWKKATKREGQGKYSIVESLNSKQWCKSLLDTSPESLKPVGQRFELVPQKDPTGLAAGNKLPIKVVFDGQPVEGAIITTGGGHASDTNNPLKTDKDGMANVTIEKAGSQMVKASHKVPIKDDPDADVLSLSSSLTFETK